MGNAEKQAIHWSTREDDGATLSAAASMTLAVELFARSLEQRVGGRSWWKLDGGFSDISSDAKPCWVSWLHPLSDRKNCLPSRLNSIRSHSNKHSNHCRGKTPLSTPRTKQEITLSKKVDSLQQPLIKPLSPASRFGRAALELPCTL